MKKGIICFVSMLALAVVISACSSLPKPTSSDDCLIVMKSLRQNSTSFTSASQERHFYLELSGGYEPVHINNKYTAFVIREPGVAISAISSKVGASAKGQTTNTKVDIKLPYRPGHVIIVDFVFVHTIKEAGQNSVVSNIEFRQLGESEKRELALALQDDPAFEGWEL